MLMVMQQNTIKAIVETESKLNMKMKTTLTYLNDLLLNPSFCYSAFLCFLHRLLWNDPEVQYTSGVDVRWVKGNATLLNNRVE